MMADLRHLLAIYVHAHQTGNSVPPHIDAEARAALADEPAAPAPPADGEAAELVDWLQNHASARGTMQRESFLRAAELLQRQALVPVSVSERLPGDELCWWYEPDEDDDPTGYGGNWTLLRIRGSVSFYTHWLPAHALPLPEVGK